MIDRVRGLCKLYIYPVQDIEQFDLGKASTHVTHEGGEVLSRNKRHRKQTSGYKAFFSPSFSLFHKSSVAPVW